MNENVDLRCHMLDVFHFAGFGASVKEAEQVLAELKDCAFLTVFDTVNRVTTRGTNTILLLK